MSGESAVLFVARRSLSREVAYELREAAGISGRRASDCRNIGSAVQSVVEAWGLSVVRDLVGHGIGMDFHEEPQVPNYGEPKRGTKLVPELTIAIEPR